jgi:hypothetical protein
MLDVSINGHIGTAVAAALGALVAANAPALQALHVSGEEVTEEGLVPLFDALPANTHLRMLSCAYDRNGATAAFARELLLPAVRANSSLHALYMFEADDSRSDQEDEEEPEALRLLLQAETLVAVRNDAAP